jgi:hypothetical protein
MKHMCVCEAALTKERETTDTFAAKQPIDSDANANHPCKRYGFSPPLSLSAHACVRPRPQLRRLAHDMTTTQLCKRRSRRQAVRRARTHARTHALERQENGTIQKVMFSSLSDAPTRSQRERGGQG